MSANTNISSTNFAQFNAFRHPTHFSHQSVPLRPWERPNFARTLLSPPSVNFSRFTDSNLPVQYPTASSISHNPSLSHLILHRSMTASHFTAMRPFDPMQNVRHSAMHVQQQLLSAINAKYAEISSSSKETWRDGIHKLGITSPSRPLWTREEQLWMQTRQFTPPSQLADQFRLSRAPFAVARSRGQSMTLPSTNSVDAFARQALLSHTMQSRNAQRASFNFSKQAHGLQERIIIDLRTFGKALFPNGEFASMPMTGYLIIEKSNGALFHFENSAPFAMTQSNFSFSDDMSIPSEHRIKNSSEQNLKHYLMQIVSLIKDYARQAKLDADHPKESHSADFNNGFLIAYHQVVAMMKNQASFFALTQEELNLADIEPERDLL